MNLCVQILNKAVRWLLYKRTRGPDGSAGAPTHLIDHSPQHGALARGPLQPLAGGWEGGQPHAPPVAAAPGPQAAPVRLFGPGDTRPPKPFQLLLLLLAAVVPGRSGQPRPAGGLLPHFDLPLGSRQALGACAVQLEKQI